MKEKKKRNKKKKKTLSLFVMLVRMKRHRSHFAKTNSICCRQIPLTHPDCAGFFHSLSLIPPPLASSYFEARPEHNRLVDYTHERRHKRVKERRERERRQQNQWVSIWMSLLLLSQSNSFESMNVTAVRVRQFNLYQIPCRRVTLTTTSPSDHGIGILPSDQCIERSHKK